MPPNDARSTLLHQEMTGVPEVEHDDIQQQQRSSCSCHTERAKGDGAEVHRHYELLLLAQFLVDGVPRLVGGESGRRGGSCRTRGLRIDRCGGRPLLLDS